jgi:hypothetical protein
VPDNGTASTAIDFGDEADPDTKEVSRRRKKGKGRAK